MQRNQSEEGQLRLIGGGEDVDCRVLVCDATAEEGINLQMANVIFHVDLPWRAFRLEQRIGRADRYIAEAVEPVKSLVFSFGEARFGENWFSIVADAVGVFDHSVSALQHVLSDLEEELHWKTMLAGASALDDNFVAARSRIKAESDQIVMHDALDAVESNEVSLSNRQLIELDDDSTLTSALKRWLTGVGTRVHRPRNGTIRLASKSRPQVPFALQLTLAPWFQEELATERSAAVEHGLPILRAGHSLVDAVAKHLQSDDRGVAFSLFRPEPGRWPPTVYLRTDFLVSLRISDELRHLMESGGWMNWLSTMLDSAAAPLVETTFTSLNGESVDHPTLRRSYDKAKGDLNLTSRPYLFRTLTAHLDWQALCSQGLENGLSVLRTRDSMTQYPVRVAEELQSSIAMRLTRLRVRRNTGLGGDDFNPKALADLLAAWPSRLATNVEILGCGAIFLADPSRAGLS